MCLRSKDQNTQRVALLARLCQCSQSVCSLSVTFPNGGHRVLSSRVTPMCPSEKKSDTQQ